MVLSSKKLKPSLGPALERMEGIHGTRHLGTTLTYMHFISKMMEGVHGTCHLGTTLTYMHVISKMLEGVHGTRHLGPHSPLCMPSQK
jgi:hypothetical protein